MAHTHQSHLEIAADHLKRTGELGAFTAIYDGRCICGMTKRNTRLAATISVLRHDYGWDIQTRQKPGELAKYILMSPGGMPGKPLPEYVVPTRPKVYPNYSGKAVPPDAVPLSDRVFCPHCTNEVSPLGQPLLGGYREARCSNCNRDVKAMPWKPEHPIVSVPPPKRSRVGRR